MNRLQSPPAGRQVPQDINAIIEIPAHSGPVKYEVDKSTGLLVVDRFMATPMYYPANYGYIPNTLSEDGDPLDILVITPTPLVHGALINCRPIGLLAMRDESGEDAKIIGVPHDSISTYYQHIQSPEDLPPSIKGGIQHFFSHYKDLETNKWVEIDGWQGVDYANKTIEDSVTRFQNQ